MNSSRVPSRRKFIVSGGKVLIAGAISTVFPLWKLHADAPNLSATNNNDRVVTLCSPSDSSFQWQLDSLFPGLRQDPVFQSILPAAILVTNTSGPAIKAISTTWTLAKGNNLEQKNSFFYLRAGSRSLLSAGQNLVGIGQTRLVTPFLTLNPGKFVLGKAPNWYRAFNRGESRKNFAELIKNITGTSAQVDAIIYSDWTLAGQDPYGLAGHLTTRRNAEHDEAVSLLRLMRTAPDRSVIRAKLNRHHTLEGIAGSAIPKSDTRKYWYYRFRALHAKVLLKRFKKSNNSTFLKQLTSLRNRPKLAIQKQSW